MVRVKGAVHITIIYRADNIRVFLHSPGALSTLVEEAGARSEFGGLESNGDFAKMLVSASM